MAYRITLLLLLFLVLFPKQVLAQNNSYISIVNPQRIAPYTKDPVKSFTAEYFEIEKRSLPATWPVTYDVLLHENFVRALKNLDSKQELGLFLEVTPSFAKDANVIYNQTNSWHRANSLFTTGYRQQDRVKLIDTVFKKFKDTFGYYPTSVGAWYIDSFSLEYMQKKYKITASINMSDQYDLDGYQLWGSPWSTPYYPSKINAAAPGDLDVLMLRWAPREPLNGYQTHSNIANPHGTGLTPSLFSLQDFATINLPLSYFTNLLKVYAIKKPYNEFGHAVIGLEGELEPTVYASFYASVLNVASKMQNKNEVKIVTMKDFAKWYKNNVSENIHIIESSDLVNGVDETAYWVQTPHYRIGFVSNAKTNTTKIVDLRMYQKNFEEPFLKSPNKQFTLSMNLPYIIDSVIEPQSAWDLGIGAVKNTGNNILTFNKGEIRFTKDTIIFPKNIVFPNHVTTSKYATLSKTSLLTASPFPVGKKGSVHVDFSVKIPFTITRRLPIFIAEYLPKIYFPIPQLYTISQSEMDALKVLESLPDGKVLTYNRDCLDCAYETRFKPAAMAGKKEYVEKYSGKKIYEDLKFSTARSSKEAKNELMKKNITYVYLSNYEDYIEPLPYIPEDLGLERVYENANAKIWKVIR